MCSYFNDSSALKILDYYLIRFHNIDYASIIWHSDIICQTQSFFTIQRQIYELSRTV